MRRLSTKEKKWCALMSIGFFVSWIFIVLQMIGILPYGAMFYTVDEKENIYIVEEMNSVRIISTDGEVSTFHLFSTLEFASVNVVGDTIEFLYDQGGKLITDLQGRYIESDLSEGRTYHPNQRLEYPVTSPNGTMYECQSIFGFYRIDEIRLDGQRIVRYRMPAKIVFSRIIHYVVIFYLAFWAIFIPIYFIKNKRGVSEGRFS